jgi:hypothetical protein
VHVTVDLTSVPAHVWLAEPADCRSFDVVVQGPGHQQALDQALRGASVGRTEGEVAWVTVAAVRRLAAGSVGQGWEADLLAMLDFARGRGWLTDDGESIQAHVEWQ